MKKVQKKISEPTGKPMVKLPSISEKLAMNRRLAEKYPDMMNKTGGWVEKLKKGVRKELGDTQGTKDIEDALRKEKVDEETIKRFRNK